MTEENEFKLTDEELASISGGANGEQKYIRYTVLKGDTLTKLAYRFNTTIAAIMNLNPIITNPDLIRVGWVLTIPYNR